MMWANLTTVICPKELVDLLKGYIADLHAASGLMQRQTSSVNTLPLSTILKVPMPPMQEISSDTCTYYTIFNPV